MAELTLLLHEWARGTPGALEQLLPLIYPDLHSLASAFLRRGASPVTLQTTAVVNDLFVKLLSRRPRQIDNRRHFYVLAARRGGGLQRVPLHDELAWVDAAGEDVVAFDRALAELERFDPEQAELVSARFLLGCTADETAQLTGLSKATVDRRVRLARGWLYRRLRGHGGPERRDSTS